MTSKKSKRHFRSGVVMSTLGATALALCVTPSTAQVVATSVYNVAAYGATPNNSSDDDRAGIQSAIDAALNFAGDSVIYFPPGKYHVDTYAGLGTSVLKILGNVGGPNPSSVLVRSGAGGVAEIVVRPRLANSLNVGCLEVQNLANVTLKGLKIDYRNDNGEPTTFTQGTVRGLGLGVTGQPDTGYVYLQVDSGYLAPKLNSRKTHAIDPATGGFRGHVANRLITSVNLVPNTTDVYLMKHMGIHPNNDNLQLGDRVAIPHSPTGRAIVFVQDVDGINVLDLEINAGAHMAMMIRDSKDTFVNGVSIVPGAPASPSDPARMISSNRDGIHVSDNRGSLSIINCTVYGTDDDAITSHGFSFALTSILTPKRVRITKEKSDQDEPVPGDELRFFDVQADSYITRTVQAVSAVGGDVYDVALTTIVYPTNLPVNFADVHIVNLETVGNNITFTGNNCERIAGRAIMIWGSNGLIDNNTSLHTKSSGIEVMTNLARGTWDAGVSEGVIITNNEIRHAAEGETPKNVARGGVIVYNNTDGDPQNWASPDLYHSITIEDNLFENIHGPNVIISNATSVQVRNNIFDSVNVQSVAPNHPFHNRDLLLTAVVDLEYVTQIAFAGNIITNTNVSTFVTPPGEVNKFVGFRNCGVISPTLYPIPPTTGPPIPMPDMGFTVN